MLIFSSRLAEYQNNTKEFFLAQDFLPLNLTDLFFLFAPQFWLTALESKPVLGKRGWRSLYIESDLTCFVADLLCVFVMSQRTGGSRWSWTLEESVRVSWKVTFFYVVLVTCTMVSGLKGTAFWPLCGVVGSTLYVNKVLCSMIILNQKCYIQQP